MLIQQIVFSLASVSFLGECKGLLYCIIVYCCFFWIFTGAIARVFLLTVDFYLLLTTCK